MNGLDKIMRSERRKRYKGLRKLRKARDMATKYTNKKILLSTLDTQGWHERLRDYFIPNLAREIVTHVNRVKIKPPKPPSQQVKAIE